MKSQLQQLENNEAILLMYLANELPPQDQAEVSEMLASDPNLRAELEILRQTQDLAFDALRSLDALTRPAVPPVVAQQRAWELIRRWVHRRHEPVSGMSIASRQLPWRRIGVAVAASMMISYYVWAVYHPNYNFENQATNAPINRVGDPDGFPDLPQLTPHRDLSDQEKVALLSIPLDDSTSDDSNLHVAEVASVTPSDTDYPGDAGRNMNSDSTNVEAP
jgi:hypothetical protein